MPLIGLRDIRHLGIAGKKRLMSKGNYFLFEPILSIMDAKIWGLETPGSFLLLTACLTPKLSALAAWNVIARPFMG